MPGSLDSCINNVFEDGNIPASAGIPPVRVLLKDALEAAMSEAAAASDAVDFEAASIWDEDVAETATAVDAPSATVVSWSTTFNQSLSADSNGWIGNLRQFLPASLITVSGSMVRITFQAANADAAHVGAAYIGHAATSGDAFDFAATPAQITVGSATSWNVPAATQVVSDAITFALDETKNVIVAVYFDLAADDDVRGAGGISGANAYFKAGANDAGTVNTTGYSSSANFIRFITRIEVS